jgi:hypothetical protein
LDDHKGKPANSEIAGNIPNIMLKASGMRLAIVFRD